MSVRLEHESRERGTHVEVDVHRLVRESALPDVGTDPESEEDGRGEVRLEEALGGEGGVGIASSDGPDGDVELGDEDEGDEADSEPGADNATEGLEGKLLERMALANPGGPETDAARRRVSGNRCVAVARGTYWQRQMAAQVKRVESPERARSQSKMAPPWGRTLKLQKKQSSVANWCRSEREERTRRWGPRRGRRGRTREGDPTCRRRRST